MKKEIDSPADSYEASLTEEQRIAFRTLLLSGVTLAEAHEKTLPWPSGPAQGKKPSLSSLGRARLRLRIQERVARIEEARIAARTARDSTHHLAKSLREKDMMDAAVALLGQKLIDGCLGLEDGNAGAAVAWLLLRRADQRLAEERLALSRAQFEKANPPPPPPLTQEEKEQRVKEIFGI